MNEPQFDAVEKPRHYNAHASGVQTIEITAPMGFCLGNAVKYLWRCDEKGAALEDLRKSAWYVRHELNRRVEVGIDSRRVMQSLGNGDALSAFLAHEPAAFKRDAIELLWRAETWPHALDELRRALALILAEVARREALAPTP